jgi:hypothetical protein
MTIPSYQLIVSQAKLASAATTLVDYYQLAQQRTLTEQVPYGVELQGVACSPANSCARLVYYPLDGSGVPAPSPTALPSPNPTPLQLPTDIIVSASPTPSMTLVQFRTNAAPVSSGKLILQDTIRNRRKDVTIGPTGSVAANGNEY